MAVRMLLVLLTLTGLVPAGDCACAACVSARRAAAARADADHVDAGLVSGCPAEHDHDDSHPIHHHSDCPALGARFDLLPSFAPAPFSGSDLADVALAAWGSWSSEQTVTRRCIRSPSRPSARALPLYLSQSALQV